jgi:putative CocE/NonD family hydrolase
MHAMSMRPPALKAVFAGCFSWHKYDAFRRGGIFAQWGTGPTRSIEEEMNVKPVDGDASKILLREAVTEHQRSTPLFEMWKGLPYRDSYSPLVASRFWQEGSAANYMDQIQRSGAALYIMAGWQDELRDQGVIAFLNIPGSRIVFGPWLHCMNDGFPLIEEAHRFFDQYVKGIDLGLSTEPLIHYFTRNAAPGTEWRTSGAWPLLETRYERSFLATGGKLATRPPSGTAAPAAFTVKYDVACPDASNPMTQGPFAQPCHVAGAGASFAQPALTKDTELTGHAVADLWIAADAVDANVFAYLEDVAPDGSVKVITEGRLKASLRATAPAPWLMPGSIPWHRSFVEDAAPLEPGKPVQLTFDFMPTSYLAKAGHRIQVTITGADARERARDAGTLAKTISVYTDQSHPSSVTLPVITR